ncbi:hypothetical protein AVEN_186675-1 [Araneus ventricosus]|uniref:Uncharacterized protein n=1 Tax=Araneus ventricosus TaxID=182803 RepID=A0A4Y2GA93_ARAVE|nr:hypothetical protein AVEN_186675-1 [Araneus ventricosus]
MIEKLLLESVVECDFEGFETVFVESTVNEIVSLAKILGLGVKNDIDELEEDHNRELTTAKSLWVCIVFHNKKLWSKV